MSARKRGRSGQVAEQSIGHARCHLRESERVRARPFGADGCE
jgi:hypothetical protein